MRPYPIYLDIELYLLIFVEDYNNFLKNLMPNHLFYLFMYKKNVYSFSDTLSFSKCRNVTHYTHSHTYMLYSVVYWGIKLTSIEAFFQYIIPKHNIIVGIKQLTRTLICITWYSVDLSWKSSLRHTKVRAGTGVARFPKYFKKSHSRKIHLPVFPAQGSRCKYCNLSVSSWIF